MEGYPKIKRWQLFWHKLKNLRPRCRASCCVGKCDLPMFHRGPHKTGYMFSWRGDTCSGRTVDVDAFTEERHHAFIEDRYLKLMRKKMGE